ncbi:uncharacterized protein [Diadema setosum]|uniref:uncharacterized protein n=1 Tax=Diadema setosum TaxID=31175 RepID=UPI003B3B783E
MDSDSTELKTISNKGSVPEPGKLHVGMHEDPTSKHRTSLKQLFSPRQRSSYDVQRASQRLEQDKPPGELRIDVGEAQANSLLAEASPNNKEGEDMPLQRFASDSSHRLGVELVELPTTEHRGSWMHWVNSNRSSYNVRGASLKARQGAGEDDDTSQVVDSQETEDEDDDDVAVCKKGNRLNRCCVVVILVIFIIAVCGLLVFLTTYHAVHNAQEVPVDSSSTETMHTCLADEIWCGSPTESSHCIPGSWRCDGELDCSTAVDERDCDGPTLDFSVERAISCKNLRENFNQSCTRGGLDPDRCGYIPQCQADGKLWLRQQCTVDNRSCWCVDTRNGRTVAGTLMGADIISDDMLFISCPA